jgi:hypothetical protein
MQHCEQNAPHHPDLQKLTTISYICQVLVKTGELQVYYLADILIHLLLTLSVFSGKASFFGYKT